MHIQLPVHANVGLAVYNTTPTSGYLPVGARVEDSYRAPKWHHPGYAPDPRTMVAAVARSRGIINHTTASLVTSDKVRADTQISAPAHVARLAFKWEAVAYSVGDADIRAEIMERGPVVAAVRVNTALLTRVNTTLKKLASDNAQFDNDPGEGTVIVAIIGWNVKDWIVALPWGKFPTFGWDGTVSLPQAGDVVINVCALTPNVSMHHYADCIEVGVLPPTWDAPTTQPLPQVEKVGSVSGKHKALRPQHPPKPNVIKIVDTWIRKENNMNLTVQCSVTVVVIIVGILTLLLMRHRA